MFQNSGVNCGFIKTKQISCSFITLLHNFSEQKVWAHFLSFHLSNLILPQNKPKAIAEAPCQNRTKKHCRFSQSLQRRLASKDGSDENKWMSDGKSKEEIIWKTKKTERVSWMTERLQQSAGLQHSPSANSVRKSLKSKLTDRALSDGEVCLLHKPRTSFPCVLPPQ